MRRWISFFGCVVLASCAAAEPLTVVAAGRSDYAIYCPADAPATVQTAAAELRHYVEAATGIALPLVDAPRSPMLAVGDSPAARAAGVTLDGVALEGYRLQTVGRDLYIVGPDLEVTPQGGSSAGTRNGVMTFLERYVNVRWLAPGDDGDDVPRVETLTVPDINTVEAPGFLNRRLPYIQERRPETRQWMARQKLGWSLYLTHGHNWERPVPATAWEQHPDWFALRGGRRVPPSGRYKYCLTNDGLIDAFAQATIAYFNANPAQTCFSLSPSDSAGWCECAECTKLYETDPNGQLSVTPAVLHFYNGVAERVAKVWPDKVLAGYIYAAYVFPPHNPLPLAPNVYLIWAPSFDYGYTLFRPELQQQWDELIAQWRQVTDRIAYYDLPVHAGTESGAPAGPGLKILKFLYPRLKANQLTGVYVYGIESWGRGGATNYLLAKLAWDPDADLDALFAEYCQRAYHEGGPAIARLLTLVDEATEAHYLANPKASYTMTNDMLQEVFVPRLDELERLYTEAEAAITDPKAKARLAMLGDNLTVFWYSLGQLRMLGDRPASRFSLSAEEFNAFLTARHGSLALEPIGTTAGARQVPKLATGAAPRPGTALPVTPALLRADTHLVLQPDQTGEVVVRFSQITARGKMVNYTVTDPAGALVTSGLADPEVPLRLDAAGAALYHLFITAGSASYQVAVEHAAWALNGAVAKGIHFLGKTTPLYFEVPEGTESFTLDLESDAPGETAAAELRDPTGKVVATFDSSAVSVDRQTIRPAPAGWWSIQVKEAPTGVLDDAYVRVGAPVAPWFSPDPDHLLSVRER